MLLFSFPALTATPIGKLANAFKLATPVTLEELELLEELLTELELTMLDEELLAIDELSLLDEELLSTDELDLLDDEVATELDETPQPAITPNGAGCAAQVELAMQLLPFS